MFVMIMDGETESREGEYCSRGTLVQRDRAGIWCWSCLVLKEKFPLVLCYLLSSETRVVLAAFWWNSLSLTCWQPLLTLFKPFPLSICIFVRLFTDYILFPDSLSSSLKHIQSKLSCLRNKVIKSPFLYSTCLFTIASPSPPFIVNLSSKRGATHAFSMLPQFTGNRAFPLSLCTNWFSRSTNDSLVCFYRLFLLALSYLTPSQHLVTMTFLFLCLPYFSGLPSLRFPSSSLTSK